MIYVTTDWHIGHKNIIKYCNRPENHEEMLWDNFSVLDSSDILISLGDMFWGDKKQDLIRFASFPFRKILVIGNHESHDCVWYFQYYDFCATQFSFSYNGNKLVFSHSPVKINDGEINIHGHIHNITEKKLNDFLAKSHTNITDSHIRLAIEDVHYKPVSLDKVLKMKRGLGV